MKVNVNVHHKNNLNKASFNNNFKKIYDNKKNNALKLNNHTVDLKNFFENTQKSFLKSDMLLKKVLEKDKIKLNELLSIQYKTSKYFTEQQFSYKLIEVTVNNVKSLTQMSV